MNRTAAGLSQLGQQQTALQEGLRTGHLALATQATELANHQQALQKGIDSLVQATQRVAANGAAITAAQDVLQQTLASRSDQATEQMTVVADLQAQMQVNLDTLSAVAGQAALDILALGKGQTDLTQTVKTGVTNLGARADKVAAELTAVAAGQNSLQETWTHQVQTTSGQMARLAANQQQLQNGLDALTATAGQTALDVIAMTTRQEAIQAAVQSHDAAFDAQATTLANGQQQIQNGLDVVTATTGQASLDALALSRGQGQLAQAVQAGRQETAGLLTALSQGQQNWAARLEATQAQIAAVTGNIATLERQVAGLQGLLQTGLQGTTTLLDATDQQRQQFEAKVGRELQAVIESLAQLRQTQASLQDQIAQVHRSTQGQAENLRSVLEQIKTTSSAGGRVAEPLPEVENLTDEPESGQPPADIRIGAVLPQPQASEMTETPVAAK
jgi:chromosome segregation ATPase